MHPIASLPIALQIVCAVLGILVILAVFRLLESRLPRHFSRGDTRYHVRKFLVFTGYVLVIFFVILVFEDRLWRASLAFGVAGAGIVVALQDLIVSAAGWFAIGLSRLYSVGDRIQLGEVRGDVIDISILRTTLMETGNWVNGDLYNGRVARIPNAFILKGPVFNCSQGFRFVWDEIRIQLSSNSDHVAAREMLLAVAQEVVRDYLPEAAKSWQQVTDNYRIENSRLEPTVMLNVTAGNLEFSLCYIVDYANRAAVKDKVFTEIVDRVVRSNGSMNWPSFATTVSIEKTSYPMLPEALRPTTGGPAEYRPTPP